MRGESQEYHLESLGLQLIVLACLEFGVKRKSQEEFRLN